MHGHATKGLAVGRWGAWGLASQRDLDNTRVAVCRRAKGRSIRRPAPSAELGQQRSIRAAADLRAELMAMPCGVVKSDISFGISISPDELVVLVSKP